MAATYAHLINLEQYESSVTGDIKKCIDEIVCKTITTHASQKP